MNSIEQLHKAFLTCIQEQYPYLPEQMASINFVLNTDETKQAFGDIFISSHKF